MTRYEDKHHGDSIPCRPTDPNHTPPVSHQVGHEPVSPCCPNDASPSTLQSNIGLAKYAEKPCLGFDPAAADRSTDWRWANIDPAKPVGHPEHLRHGVPIWPNHLPFSLVSDQSNPLRCIWLVGAKAGENADFQNFQIKDHPLQMSYLG